MKQFDKKIKELISEHNRILICKALDWPEGNHSTLVFESGLEWIRRNMSLNDDSIINVIASCRLFWAWWRNQWDQRDAHFIYQTNLNKQEFPLTDRGKTIALECYYDAHNIRTIKLYPNRFVIAEVGTALKRYNHEQIQILKQIARL